MPLGVAIVVAPAGIGASMNVSETTAKEPEVPAIETLLVPVNP